AARGLHDPSHRTTTAPLPCQLSRRAPCALRAMLPSVGPEQLQLFADDAQAERKYDDKTGKPYRVYHAIPIGSKQLNLFVYVDIDEATRNQMLKSAVSRREQMVSDGYQLTLDLDHWNSVNIEKEPIILPMDLTLDIDIRKASEDGDSDDS
ncbi:MAG: hypothetical protein ACREFK_07650, partial [Stellaceae bacterium]